MGILDDFKKLFWANKAVTKSAARKVGKEAKDLAGEGYEKMKDLGDKVADKVGNAFDDAKDYASDLIDDVLKKKEQMKTNPPPSDKSATQDKETGAGSGDPAQSPPEKKAGVVDKAVEMSDKAWEKAEDLAGKAKEMAKNIKGRVDEKIDDMLERAKDLDKKIEAEKDTIDKNRDGYADTPVNEKLRQQKSPLEGKDDFWEKAARYSEGDYSMGKPQVVESSSDDDTLELKPLKDHKGDSTEENIVDDAEVVDDSTTKDENDADGNVKPKDDLPKDQDDKPKDQ